MPKCPRCEKEVYPAEEVMAAGQKWHNGCFRCKECKTALNSSNLRDREKEIYCNHCYGKLFGAKGFGFGGAAAGGEGGLADPLHGTAAIDAEIQRKLNMKFDESKEVNARVWLESLLGQKFEEKTLHEALKSGERICLALNKIFPSKPVKNINKQKFAAMQRENIANYINACKILAFNKSEIFETSDLFEGGNMVQVIENLYALARRAAKNGLAGIEEAPAGASSYSYSEPAPAPAPVSKPVAVAEPEPEPVAEPEQAAPEQAAPEAAAGGAACGDCGSTARSADGTCEDCGAPMP